MNCQQFQAIVLAGERTGGNALARSLGLPAGVLAPLAGRSCIQRVMTTLRESCSVAGGILSGPSASVLREAPEFSALLEPGDYRWLAPANGPAASAFAAAEHLNSHPLLLTGADHGLLDTATVDDFCKDALAVGPAGHRPDIVVGLVPHDLVREAFPDSKRTVLRFSDGAFCGSNLFAVTSETGHSGLRFWSEVESFRKRPWKIAGRLGLKTLLRYVTGGLAVDQAFRALSLKAGCRVSWVAVHEPRAAVDVDTVADWELACRLLEREKAAPANPQQGTGPAQGGGKRQAGGPAENRPDP